MNLPRSMNRAAVLAAIVSAFTVFATGQKDHQSAVLNAAVDTNSTVTFIWLPDEDSQFRNPMTLHVVPDNDSRLHSADLRAGEDWNAYIGAMEMGRVLDRLRGFDLKWAGTHRGAMLKNWETKIAPDTLEIIVDSSAGTARSTTRQTVCDHLSQMDTALTSPRVLWLFQLFRVDRGCIVQGFDRNRVPKE